MNKIAYEIIPFNLLDLDLSGMLEIFTSKKPTFSIEFNGGAMAISYHDSGVDVNAGDALVDWLTASPFGKKHHQKNIVSGIGGFASLFRVDFSKMEKPCLVTCTDGVGTKVKLASQFKKFDTVGQDLVAMCVNDMICSGATPLMFLDYYATGKLELEDAKSFLLGVQKACDESLCALVGGETAEMPGIYQVGDFDCAGFAVGVVDQVKALGSHLVQDGDVLLGISSSGFHSNGYSLLRKLFEQDLSEWKDVLLRPTHLYVQLMEALKSQVLLHAAANMTGSGIENIPRVIPDHLAWKMKTWALPPEFVEVQKRSGLSLDELLRTLNCGVGFVLILPEIEATKARTVIEEKGYICYDIGKIVPRVIGKDQILS